MLYYYHTNYYKKLFTKYMFKKIIFLIFIFSIFSTFIIQEKSFAFSVGVGTCTWTSTTTTEYVVSSADLSGSLPLCFYDNNNTDRLTLWKDFANEDNNKICFSNTTAISGVWDYVGTSSAANSNCTTNRAASSTFPAGSSVAPNKINFPLVESDFTKTNGVWNKNQTFWIKDPTSNEKEAYYDLTLRPATITMTSNISGGNFRTTNGELNTVLGTPEANIPRNLKHGNTFNVSCTNTTDLWIESKSDTGSPTIPAANLGATITTSGNTKSISIRYDATTTNKTFQITCKNIGGHGGSGGNSVYTQFVTPKRFTVSYRNWTPTTTIPAKRV